MKVALGSVQFGCDYGISNQSGQVDSLSLQQILDYAHDKGIELIDTAPAYGNSEKNLGKQLAAKNFSFVSKIPPDCQLENIVTCCQTSLHHLKSKKLYGLMLHHGEQLLSHDGDKIYQQLQLTKERGLTDKIGCSVYSAEHAIEISNKFSIDLIQLPANIFDQGIFHGDILNQLKRKGIEIHIRSLFLQGAIFLTNKSLPKYLISLAPYLTKLTKLTEQYPNEQKNTVLIALALAPFIQNDAIDQLVLGSCSPLELKQIITAYQLAENIAYDFKEFAITDPKIINPSLWG